MKLYAKSKGYNSFLTFALIKKYAYNANIKNIEDRIPDNANFATKTTINAKIRG